MVTTPTGPFSLRNVRSSLAFELRCVVKRLFRPVIQYCPERQAGQRPTAIYHLKGRLLSSNIGELNRLATRSSCDLAGSGGKTLIFQAGDFFAHPQSPNALAHRRWATDGALW